VRDDLLLACRIAHCTLDLCGQPQHAAAFLEPTRGLIRCVLWARSSRCQGHTDQAARSHTWAPLVQTHTSRKHTGHWGGRTASTAPQTSCSCLLRWPPCCSCWRVC
jgi:hypothetical protein